MKTETFNYMPKRYKKPSVSLIVGIMIYVFLLFKGMQAADVSIERLVRSFGHLTNFLARSFPPNFESFGYDVISMYETFQMALVGTTAGILLSFPIAILASKNTTVSPVVSMITKTIVTTMRTIPDLIWALIFIITVGLGVLPGILTITVDIIGYCSRMFYERIEEMPEGPMNALSATGASKTAVVLGAVFPMGIPSFVATSLYSLEKSIRGATILGIVGAGGIGVRLNNAMKFRQFDRASAIILLILIVVLLTQYISNKIRSKMI